MAIVKWFAGVTAAEMEGNKPGSEVLTFRPKQRASPKLIKREIRLNPGSMTASSVLFFQTVLPFLLLVGVDPKSHLPVVLSIDGATNCVDAPSFEYLDQVFLPALEKYFGIVVGRQMTRRGWGQMTPDPRTVQKGKILFKFFSLEWATALQPCKGVKMCDEEDEDPHAMQGDTDVSYGTRSLDTTIESVVATIVTPLEFHEPLQEALAEDIDSRFPGAEVEFKCEDSGHSDRFYVLLVAKSEYCRWGRDVITAKRLRGVHVASMSKEISSKLVKDLEDEVSGERGDCPIDTYLQDQFVIFQCLAEGRTCFPRNRKDQSTEFALKNLHPDFPLKEDPLIKLPVKNASSNDSKHTHLARYAAKMMLPEARFYNDGKVCVGAAVKAGQKVEGKK